MHIAQSLGLICLCVVLVLIYMAWVILTFRYHLQVRAVQIERPLGLFISVIVVPILLYLTWVILAFR
jgi:hypothetical protein